MAAADKPNSRETGADRVAELHDAAVAAGRDSYVDPKTKYAVFTAAFLVGRGTCCTSGCRHCPYR